MRQMLGLVDTDSAEFYIVSHIPALTWLGVKNDRSQVSLLSPI